MKNQEKRLHRPRIASRLVSLIAVLLAVICVVSLASCGAVRSADGYAESNGYYGGIESGGKTNGSTSASDESLSVGSDTVASDRKIVKTVDLSLECYDYTATASSVTDAADVVGGYVESCEEYGTSMLSSDSRVGRHGRYTVRVPADKLDEFTAAISGGDVNVLSRSESTEDITDSYYDTESRISSLRTQLERLEQLLGEASDVSTMLDIESRLAEVRYELESYQSTMQRYEKRIAYSTVNISITEVRVYSEQSEDSFAQRIGKAFASSWADFVDGLGNFAVGLVYVFPVLLLLAVIAVIVVLIVRSARRRRSARKAATSAETAPAAAAHTAAAHTSSAAGSADSGHDVGTDGTDRSTDE